MTKTIIILAALIAAPISAKAEGEAKLVIAIKRDTWQEASPRKREAIKEFFRRFVRDSHGVTPQATYTHTASGASVMVACYDMGKLKGRNSEDFDDIKLVELKASLRDVQIRIEATNDPHALLASWGLEQGL